MLLCDICQTLSLRLFKSFGEFPNLNTERFAITKTLEVYGCEFCSVVQIPNRFSRSELFPPEYYFRSRLTRSLRDNFIELANCITEYLAPESRILEIGCNDGFLLEILDALGYDVFGLEPTLARFDSKLIERIHGSFFEEHSFKSKFDAIILTNTFAHLDSPRQALMKIIDLLKPGGLLVIEVVDLKQMIAKNEIDKFTIEHGFYFSIDSLRRLLGQFGFAELSSNSIDTHGGSIRYIAQFTGCIQELPVYPSNLFKELKMMFNRIEHLQIELHKLISSVETSKDFGFLIGATTRGVTLIRALDVDINKFKFIIDHPNSPRVGTKMPLLDLPVFSDNHMPESKNAFGLVLAWHIAPDIIRKMRAIGYEGELIIPLPHPHIVK
jgi:SAM-dependent methyltransferase